MIEPFAIWVTGLPASGKSTLAAAIRNELARIGVDIAVLESDELRRVLTPRPRYDEEERETFYSAMLHIGLILLRHGIPVLFDATANLRRYRDRARELIPRFIEVYVECPIEVCAARDPKGLYRKAREGKVDTLPGLQASFEPPLQPDVVVRGDLENPQSAAKRVLTLLGAQNAPSVF